MFNPFKKWAKRPIARGFPETQDSTSLPFLVRLRLSGPLLNWEVCLRRNRPKDAMSAGESGLKWR